MADSASKVAAEKPHEDADVINRKARILVDHIRKSKHFIAFTGTGTSNSAGHSDACPYGAGGVAESRHSEVLGQSKLRRLTPEERHFINFRAVSKYEKSIHDYRTGRECARCKGSTTRYIEYYCINFGEALPADVL
ncbi:putative NAD-dependent protein deacetylase SRT1 [Seiridium unicorne]|uniref:NAD-dependent protein deacetylase SRT1 n=1 Tax=Seiridium unicorne TaxID=138068 RepID=A0ABR2UWF4_9PEZI